MTLRRFGRHACALALAAVFAASPAHAQIAGAPAITQESIAPFARSGSGSISGRVVASLPGDRLRYFDKWQVFLVPAITYTFYFEHLVIDAWKDDGLVPEPDPAFLKLVRSTISDGNGYFKFSNLAKGTYLVYAVVEVKDGRQETLTSSSFEQTGTTTYLSGGVPIGESPEYGYVARPYLHDYTCLTTGVVGGAVDVLHGEAEKVNLALVGQRNDGC